MTVDFVFKKAPSYRVASIRYTGRWRENHLRAEFRELTAWAKRNGARAGRWLFCEIDGPNSRRADSQRRWEACLEIKGTAPPAGRIKFKTLPVHRVASVTFDPEKVSARLIYHGLADWLRGRQKEGDIRRA